MMKKILKKKKKLKKALKGGRSESRRPGLLEDYVINLKKSMVTFQKQF